ncbi:MAG TPA: hypothetical protein VFX97_16955 [Pyrinomonadaceae bacterium]|nr:hypothetical protein [Pyrinomonadaceae bacterium]
MAELRKLWPGCSFEIQNSRNAGFHQDATQHFEIGVISTQYEVHERFKGRTLAEAMQKVREFHAACATAREAMKDE